MIEPLDPESFVLRAEGEMDTCSAYAVADLQYAIEIDPRHLRAHRMLMVLMCEQGKWQQALALAEAAERIDPTDAWTRLKHAGILLALDRPEEARTAVESVKTIPKWMARSEAVVAECKAEPDVQQALELQLCRGALVVAAGSTDSVEPLPWVKRLLEVRDRMGDTVKDPWRRREIDWEVGLGLLDALSAAQIRGDASDMLDNATLTAAYLERGGEHRELTAKERKNVGDLLFRIGIMHSLQRGDHATAVTWFDRVIPLWDGNPRLERDGEAGQLGESYISMAISYWQVDRRDDALALSRRGVDLMVAAVDAKQLDERSLAVAYGNLATMYAEQGDESQSQTYAELASRAEASGTTLR
jgi:tetratricopeptide (TPR) repeat protein